MPELIERGYLYIAQPPLFRIKKGSSETYLKDESALEQHLIGEGIKDAVLTLGDGTQVAQGDLRALVEQAAMIRSSINVLARKKGRPEIIEQAGIAGCFRPNIFADPVAANRVATQAAARLDRLAAEYEKGWQGRGEVSNFAGGNAFIFTRTLRGVLQRYDLDQGQLSSADGRRIQSAEEELARIYQEMAMLQVKDKSVPIYGPLSLADAVMELGRRGQAINRYKGLGEMNPEQLWETTLDSNVRSLLQVRVNHAEEAENVFSTLMGDVVEPRREFIQSNALEVANLDV
jgi:DNA gyrase subunit B